VCEAGVKGEEVSRGLIVIGVEEGEDGGVFDMPEEFGRGVEVERCVVEGERDAEGLFVGRLAVEEEGSLLGCVEREYDGEREYLDGELISDAGGLYTEGGEVGEDVGKEWEKLDLVAPEFVSGGSAWGDPALIAERPGDQKAVGADLFTVDENAGAEESGEIFGEAEGIAVGEKAALVTQFEGDGRG
jgi:hypothetical protein